MGEDKNTKKPEEKTSRRGFFGKVVRGATTVFGTGVILRQTGKWLASDIIQDAVAHNVEKICADLNQFLIDLGDKKTPKLDGQLRDYYRACYAASRDTNPQPILQAIAVPAYGNDRSYADSPKDLESALIKEYGTLLQPATDNLAKRVVRGSVIEELLFEIKLLAKSHADYIVPLSREVMYQKSDKGLSAILADFIAAQSRQPKKSAEATR